MTDNITEKSTSNDELEPKKAGPQEAIEDALKRLKEKIVPSKEFSFDQGMVSENAEHMEVFEKEDGTKTEMGLQVTVEFDESPFEKGFDKTFDELLALAQAGKEKIGNWNDENPTWGQYQTVPLKNGRTYGVVDETKDRTGLYERVSIRANFSGSEGKDNSGGAYYFRRRKDGSGERKINICGAKMDGGVNTVIDDIKLIVAQTATK